MDALEVIRQALTVLGIGIGIFLFLGLSHKDGRDELGRMARLIGAALFRKCCAVWVSVKPYRQKHAAQDHTSTHQGS